MMGLRLQLSINCDVCGTPDSVDPVASSVELRLFGAADRITLVRQGICPKCFRFKGKFTSKKDRARLANYFLDSLLEELDKDSEVVRLRVGIARLAQVAGLGSFIPGAPGEDAPFEVLTRVAKEQSRGWHKLLAGLMDRISVRSHL